MPAGLEHPELRCAITDLDDTAARACKNFSTSAASYIEAETFTSVV
jgi:hypothetical protein